MDLAAMLRRLATDGWTPVLYNDPRDRSEWVCYPQGAVRAWASFHAPDPAGAVRQLYRWAQDHPNEPPAFVSPAAVQAAQEPSPTPLTPIATGVAGVATYPAITLPAPWPSAPQRAFSMFRWRR
jgi:hypothetical protein